ncbi:MULTISPECIES: oxygen-insensitive NADPH nitroreductase [unclassified Moraxella]|uniref:oxygen-insensitive NADPH nitroreductase n=1 Tax=unclassified Moraxella TaxID=2685852 RepID=UPI003AF58632
MSNVITSKPTLETVLSHRSIRKFTEQPISEELLNTLFQSAIAGSSTGFLQSASIIRVTDPDLRYQIRRICADAQNAKDGEKYGHPYVEQCAELLIFCMDNHRHRQLLPEAQIDWTEVTLVGAVDCAIIAQNLLVTAESLGLGGVYLGSVRNDVPRLGELLQLPKGVFPMFGMALGYPDQDPAMRPRLPIELVVSTNHYQPATVEQMQAYNDTVKAYYVERGQAGMDWTQSVMNYLGKPARPQILPYLNQQGYAKK